MVPGYVPVELHVQSGHPLFCFDVAIIFIPHVYMLFTKLIFLQACL